MKVAKLTIIDGESIETKLHHPGVNQTWDIALCGQDLMGDNIAGATWKEAQSVDGKIDCPDCIAIIKACKALRKSDFVCSLNVKL